MDADADYGRRLAMWLWWVGGGRELWETVPCVAAATRWESMPYDQNVADICQRRPREPAGILLYTDPPFLQYATPAKGAHGGWQVAIAAGDIVLQDYVSGSSAI